MEKKAFENKYIKFVFCEEKRLMKFIWESTFGLMDAEFRDVLQAQTEHLILYKPTTVLIDNTNFGFPIDPELQEWVNETCLTQWHNEYTKKIAITITKEIIAQLSVEQIWEEPIGQKFNVRFFEYVTEAEAWLA